MPKFAIGCTEDSEVWLFRLWRPFLAVRVTRIERLGLFRFEPAFYSEIVKLPPRVLETALLQTVKAGVDRLDGYGARKKMSAEIVVRDGIAAPPPMAVYAGVMHGVIAAGPTKQFFGEVELRKADTEHPFWRVDKIANGRSQPADPNSPEVSALERCWIEEGWSARELLAMFYRVPREWAYSGT